MSKELMRTALLSEISSHFSADQLELISKAFDRVSAHYIVTPESTDLIVYDDALMNAVKGYIVTKKTEHMSDGTIQGYWITLKMFADTIGKPLASITVNDVRMWFWNYQEHRKISDRTLNHLEGIVKTFFAWMADEGIIQHDILHSFKRCQYKPRQKEALSSMQLESLLDSSKGNIRDHCILLMLYSTGCRVSQLANMKVSELSMEKHEIKVIGKGNKERTVYFEGRAVLALSAWLSKRPDKGQYLFPGRKAGTHLGTKQLLNIVKKYAAASKCPAKTTPHTMRHTTATLALQRGCPVQDVQRMLGHSNISTTMIYAQVDQSQVKSEHSRCIV